MTTFDRDSLSHEPWWWVEAPPRSLSPTQIEPECDVAIIGAGYTGLTAALTLAKAGKSVQVFEKERPGEGASSRNGGITSGSLRIGLKQAIKAFGETRGIGLHREAISARQFLRQLIQDNDIDCDYALNGLFSGALTEADFTTQKRTVEVMNRVLSAHLEIIDRSHLSDITGSECYVGGVLNRDIGTIHPAKLVSGLLEAALRQRAVVHGETAVTKVVRSRSEFLIETVRGNCRARHVIVATNGYTDASDPWLRHRVFPIRSRIVVTQELSSNLISSLMPDCRAMGELKKLYCYYRVTPDGRRILLGGREPAWGHDKTAAIEHVRKGLGRIFPALDGVALSHSWSGNVAFSRRHLPLMFQNEGLHYAVGYCGSGTVWAPWLGHKTALKILGDPGSISHFDGPAPKGIPFLHGEPWFLPMAMSGYRLSDWMRGRV